MTDDNTVDTTDMTVAELDDLASDEETVFEGLSYLEMPNGLHLFVNVDDTTIPTIVALGYKQFYILGTYQSEKKVVKAGRDEIEYGPTQPRIFRYTKSLLAEWIVEEEVSTLGGLARVREKALFKLPPIPYLLIKKIDYFFRKIDELRGTEAIIVFTYDKRYLETEHPEDGWGMIVPEQTNTAGHCDYDPPSVVDMIAEEDMEFIYTVGTAHSHPGMGAFASGTDAHDQNHNDGLHITFGWTAAQPKTDFHIELQAGSTWTLKPSDAFGDLPPVEEFPELDPLLDRVKKQTTPVNSYAQGSYGSYNPPKALGTGPTGSTQGKKPIWPVGGAYPPVGCPDPETNTIIVELNEHYPRRCPVCDFGVVALDTQDRQCPNCHSYFAKPGESFDDVVATRAGRSFSVDELVDPGTKDVVWWRSWVDEQGTIHHNQHVVVAAITDPGKVNPS